MTAKPHILIEDRIVHWIRSRDCDEYIELLADARREIIELRNVVRILKESLIDRPREQLQAEASRLGIKGDESHTDLITGKRSVDDYDYYD